MQALESIRVLSKYRDSSRMHFDHKCLRILGLSVSYQNFATHFLDEVLFQDMVHIDDLPLLGNTQVVFICSSSTF